MALSLADWVMGSVIESRDRPPRTESILDDPRLQSKRLLFFP